MLSLPERINIFLVESHYLFVLGLRSIIDGASRLHIVGESRDPSAAIGAICHARPHVVLLDMADSGLSLAEEIRKDLSETRVLVMGADFSPPELNALFQVGVTGVCRRMIAPERLHSAIVAVHAGDIYIDGSIGCSLRAGDMPTSPIVGGLLERLTPREAQILTLIARGATNKQISEMLFLSVSTVKVLIRQILQKLQVEDRTQAAVVAMRTGLIAVDV
jgi:DNA-binding NarL/FixJ family response regulator